MANEVTVNTTLNATKSGVTVNTGGQSKLVDMDGDQMLTNVQTIGTSAEALVIGDIASLGWIFVRNLDAANFVELALDSAVSTQVFAKLLAGEWALFPAKTGTMYAKADTAECNIQVVAIER